MEEGGTTVSTTSCSFASQTRTRRSGRSLTIAPSVERCDVTDLIFKNQASGTEDKNKKKEFVNDLLRSDFHRASLFHSVSRFFRASVDSIASYTTLSIVAFRPIHRSIHGQVPQVRKACAVERRWGAVSVLGLRGTRRVRIPLLCHHLTSLLEHLGLRLRRSRKDYRGSDAATSLVARDGRALPPFRHSTPLFSQVLLLS